MRIVISLSAVLFLGVCCAGTASAQPTQPVVMPRSAVPRLIPVSGSFHLAEGMAAAPVESVVLGIYAQASGGTPLWQEVQSVALDSAGRYQMQLGATGSEGLPLELFAAGEPRWLEVQFQRPGESEQPRTLLGSVPYALMAMKAADADTLGGRPASAYLLAGAATNSVAAAVPGNAAGAPGASTSKPSAATTKVTGSVGSAGVPLKVNSGNPNYHSKFTNTTDLGNTVMYETAGRIGLSNTNPLDFLHVTFSDGNGGVTGYAVQNLSGAAAAYSGMLFYDQNGALGQFQGFNNATHEYRINNVASSGSINFMLAGASKFKVRSDGDVEISGSIRRSGILYLHGLGTGNNSVGFNALPATNTGTYNNAVGNGALAANTTGFQNNAMGADALGANNGGGNNVAVGDEAMASNVSGGSNTAIGVNALNLTNGSYNIGIGWSGGANLGGGNSNIAIGHIGLPADANTIRIGTAGSHIRTFIAGITGVTTGNPNPATVLIDSAGQLGVITSSRRFKEDIADMGPASNGLLRLRPVTYRYKQPYADGSKPGDYGLIAEEVAEVYPDLVVKSADGQIETVQYHKLVPMLLNELQKQQRTIEAQAVAMSRQIARIAELELDRKAQFARLDALEKQATEMAILKQQVAGLQAAVLTAGVREPARLAVAR